MMERFDAEQRARRRSSEYRVTARPVRADDVRAHAEAARRRCATATTSRQPAGRHPRRRAVPGRGQAGDDRLVGPDPRTSTTPAPRATASPSSTSAEWLTQPGSVGTRRARPLHICDDDGDELPVGRGRARSTSSATRCPFEYHNDPAKTAAAQHPTHPDWTTLGDIGYVDDDGYLYPHRPQGVHDHLGRREHLPAGDRERPRHCTRRSPTSPCSASPTRRWARRSRRSCSPCQVPEPEPGWPRN